MQVTIPQNIKDITLEQFQKYSKVIESNKSEREKQKRLISIFTDISYADTDNIINKDFEFLINSITEAMSKDAEFTPIFKIGQQEFGFIPNFDKLTAKEWFDLQLYPLDKIDKLHKLMAILFRPIKNKNVFNHYRIKSYNGTDEYSELMKQMPLSVVNGALVFFYHLGMELSIHTQKYTRVEQVRAKML